MRNVRGRWTTGFAGYIGVVCLCTGLVGCGSDSTSPEKSVAEVSVSPSSLTLAVGQTQSLTATTKDAGGNVLTGRPVTWSSNDTNVATVSQSGAATGVGAGTATITATSEGKSGTATVTVPLHALTVTKSGTGNGTVTSIPAGIDCGAACEASYPAGTVVTLTAAPAAGSVFEGWSGACTGETSTCQVTVNEASNVTATFTRLHTLLVTKDGAGSGVVTSSPAGIDCGAECEAIYAAGTVVTLTATADDGSAFVGWSGSCAGTDLSCQVTMDAAKGITATFTPVYTLTLTKTGAGSGTVTSSPAGIDCGAACEAVFASGTMVTLMATPESGSVLTAWTGACLGTASTCQVAMDAAKDVTVVFGEASSAFVTTWDTSLGSGTTVTLALGGQVDATIHWGDGTSITVTSPGPHVHDYGADGVYTVSVTGKAPAYNSYALGGGTSEVQKLVSVSSWGALGFTNLSRAFRGASNLVSVPGNSDGLEAVTHMDEMFFDAEKFNSDIGGWNTSNVIYMTGMFRNASSFNADIGGWNTSQVMLMNSMFSNATSFNQNLEGWDTSNVTRMNTMFSGATAFNGAIGTWNTSKVTDMFAMFSGAASFNQDIGGWNTSNVTRMNLIFSGATSFNQDIGGWNTSKITSMEWMFRDAEAFNQDLGDWDTSNVTQMARTFENATAFNGDIGNWNTSKVTRMDYMFYRASSFNREIGSWNTSSVADMQSIFMEATAFNGSIGNWNTSEVTRMDWMFYRASSFNQNIGGWDTSKVTTMDRMFDNATSFNQDLSGWCVSLIPLAPYGFDHNTTSWVLPNSRPIWGTCPVGGVS
jgi:surface protein